jgi:mono/diheme cytochrome c family protein
LTYHRLLCFAASLILALVLAACVEGGGSGDINPSSPPSEGVITGPNSFFTFPNPLIQDDGTSQVGSVSYATAYYEAIDPLNERDTLAKFKAKNGFDTGTGTQHQVVFGDVRDLGYGRRMTARQNPDGTLAFFVENYIVRLGPAYAYSSVNLDAAVLRDTRWLIGINTIEFSPGPAGGTGCLSPANPGGGICFPKFYNYNGAGVRQLTVDLDRRGQKAMPGPCISCHGGRGDPLTPPDPVTGKPLFNLVQNSASLARGDVQAHLQTFFVDTFDFSTMPGFTRADQEAALKQMNQWVLCSFPLEGAAAGPEDNCRRANTANEWVGSAATVLKKAYGGDNMPNPTFSDTYVPTAWSTVGQTTLYQNVVADSCRTCHQLRGIRGTAGQNDIDFDTFAKFQSYAERIKHHVLDFGNMPLAKLVSDRFWASSTGPDTLATFLTAEGLTARDGGGAVLRPGRPYTRLVDRVITQGPTTLSAPSTRFATTYSWTVVSGPGGAIPPTNVTLTNATSAQPTFNATANGTYVVRLVVGNGTTSSDPATATIEVNNALTPAPSAIRFSDIKAVLQDTAPVPTQRCTNCHQPGGNGTLLPPLFYTNVDRDGNAVVNATDDLWFYTEVKGRANLVDSDASAILRKPSGNHHAGGNLPGFDTTLPVGNAGRAKYDLFMNWILNNAPQ